MSNSKFTGFLKEAYKDRDLLAKDIAIFLIMAVLAGCGLIYEYLLSHYAGRVLGAVETALFSMIGIMIVAMGLGAFAARYIKCPYTGFIVLELLIAIIGTSAVLVIAGIISLSVLLPTIIASNYGMPPDLVPAGGIIKAFSSFAFFTPYIAGFILGFLLGIEIPLIARVREDVYGKHLVNNTGAIYGMDYIGAGIGAAIWVFLMLTLDSTFASALTATANLSIGFLFYFLFKENIKFRFAILLSHVLVAALILTVGTSGTTWEAQMEDLLYRDKVIYRENTRYQHVTITERTTDPSKDPIIAFYINGRTQFSSNDEHIYHAMLTYPVLAASARHKNILVIGGGDGLALRDILRWNPDKVTVVDLDGSIVKLFTHAAKGNSQYAKFRDRLSKLNGNSFSDKRVKVINGDAYIELDKLLKNNQYYDAIIVDLPDPSHPDLNKLYSAHFYAKLKHLLAGDGAIGIQSTSPYHAKHTFMSIGKTVKHAGFRFVQQYHHNVPSFGEWGWTIATKQGQSPRQRIKALKPLPVDDGWTTKGKLLAAFEFSQHYFDLLPSIKINRLGSGVMYQYHYRDWQKEQGLVTKY